jgi:NADH:ubiquinone oxidoreductase subunit F (NADH-binding)
VLDQKDEQKYITCNADEGDSGTFSDRMIMEGDPFVLIEGMIIAGLAVGASQGFIYLRVEYPHARRVLEEAIAAAYGAGYLGANVRGSGKRFDLELRIGAAAYICGEETSMLESLEGKRGEVRVRPPLPAIEGLFGKPTVVNNVISLASVPIILANGAAYYRDYGMGRSRGTLPIQLAGNIKRGGLVEKAFGITLRELLYEYGGGSASGRPIRAVQVGGRLVRTCPSRSSIRRSTTSRSMESAPCSATGESSPSTTPWTWRRWPSTRWSSVPMSRAGSARHVASDRPAAPRFSRGSDRGATPRPGSRSSVSFARQCCMDRSAGSAA